MKKITLKRAAGWSIAVLAIAVLAAIAVAPGSVDVDVAVVARGPMQVTLDQEGKTRVRERYVVSAPVSGQILRIELEPGDPVRARKTALVTFLPIEPTPLDARSRAEADASVDAAAATLDRAIADLERARAEALHADSELLRARKLAEVGIVTREALDAAEITAVASRDLVDGADAAVRAARGQLAAARAAVDVGARDLDTVAGGTHALVIYSPINGVVLRRMLESSTVVQAGEPILEVGDPAKLEVVADYLSRDAVALRPGMPVHIEQWGGSTDLTGTVTRIEPAGFMKVSALGVEEQRVNVIIAFDNSVAAWNTLGDAYRVEARTVVWRGEDVVHAAASSLFRRGDGWAVFRVVDETAHLVEIEVGRRNGLQAEIVSGLEPGDIVISHPSDDVQEGTAVTPRPS